MNDPFLDLFSIIEDRKKSKSKKSYTLSLFKEGEKKIAQKFGEESAELIIDYLKGTKKRIRLLLPWRQGLYRDQVRFLSRPQQGDDDSFSY